jgi:hypothetical protein
MQGSIMAAIWCLFVVTGVVIYFPIIYTRKTDRILKALEEIAANTRKS